MRTKGVVKLVVTMAMLALLSGGAEAREAEWNAAYWGRIDGFVYDDEDKKEAKVTGKVEGDFDLDTTTSLYAEVTWQGDELSFRLTGTYEKDSDRRSPVTDEPDDADDLDAYYARMFIPEVFKKPKLVPMPIDFVTATTKGKISVRRNFQKIKLKNTVKFEGKVVGGEYDGQTVRGKVRLKIKGERDDE